MKIIIGSEQEIAEKIAREYIELLRQKPDAVLGLATGSTPVRLYGELVKLCSRGEISFKNAHTFNLDEYLGLDEDHEQSYRYFMNHNLFEGIDIDRANTRVPSGRDTGNCESYDDEIAAAGGIDLQLLGIGIDGHIGFNEPGTPFGSRTHVVELELSTRQANSRFFASLEEVPTHAVTMGIRTVMNARRIILMATGDSKAEIVKAFIEGPVCEEVPASVLRLHPDATVYLDEKAAALLRI